MLNHLFDITHFIGQSFLNLWPYLLITIPLAVAIRMSGASKYIGRAFDARPVAAILLATLVGAFSPFCSCTVIPVIASLLISGVPLAPVMAFWVASPSMDPEIFFLSVGTIGWQLAVWRLVGTLALSLSAGFITHLAVQQGWLGQDILRSRRSTSVQSTWTLLKNGWGFFTRWLNRVWQKIAVGPLPLPVGQTAGHVPASRIIKTDPVRNPQPPPEGCGCDGAEKSVPGKDTPHLENHSHSSCGLTENGEGSSCAIKPVSFRQRLLKETWEATTMVAKFMLLAFFLEALIILYIPSDWIAGLLGNGNQGAIVAAALLGVPVYTSNLAALPLVGGLLAQGMNPGAGLAFLIAGPTTTLPAMAAVWGLASRRVFALYVSFSLIGAVVLGYVYTLYHMVA